MLRTNGEAFLLYALSSPTLMQIHGVKYFEDWEFFQEHYMCSITVVFLVVEFSNLRNAAVTPG